MRIGGVPGPEHQHAGGGLEPIDDDLPVVFAEADLPVPEDIVAILPEQPDQVLGRLGILPRMTQEYERHAGSVAYDRADAKNIR